MTEPKTCAQEGCRAPSNFIKKDGFCHAHGPGARERLQLIGVWGARTARCGLRIWCSGFTAPGQIFEARFTIWAGNGLRSNR